MQPATISVPVSVEVSVSEVLHGIFGIEGVLSYTDETITFAYQKTEFNRLFSRQQKSAEETVELSPDDMREVDLKGTKIILRPSRLITLDRMPWTSADEIIFKVKRKHRAQAAALVSQLQRVLAERSVDALRRIPFQLPDANFGLTEIKGLLYLEEAYLVFEVGTGISGGTKKKRQTIKIEPRALEAIHLDQGLRHDQLIVRPKERDLFRVMPGMYRGKDVLTLKIKKRYSADAEHLVDEVRDYLSL